ncbi:MAG TPA: NAD(P)/FAD-dependent oxidoreductase [Candidatus Binatia bacterium]|nr:NAD(P)/FAD-dependent oxidoreductase [Candidatus Binatia bacterium]
MDGTKHHVAILGGGFGGLHAAQSLNHPAFEVTLVDRCNFHLFQPLLYQVATGWLSPANIASTLRAVLKRQKNARVLLAEAKDIDVRTREVMLAPGKVAYDSLIVATGSRHHYFGHDEWESLAPGLKTVEDATEMRRRIFLAFEAAELDPDPQRVRALLTFVIVGGGPTGVELAGALAEIATDTLRHDFRRINPADARILLLEAADRILTPYPPELSKQAESFLAKHGVSVQTHAMVTAIEEGSVTMKRGEVVERLPCHTVLWAAGVRASFLGEALAKASGAQLDRSGRVFVEPDLTLRHHPEIFVIGDLANYPHQGNRPLPGVAPVAIQQGRYVARVLRCRISGHPIPSFRYRDRGNMAIVGRGTAVADFGKLHLAGFGAWLAWLFVHLINLVEFENRVLVLIQWGWYYFRRNRAARLITGESPTCVLPRAAGED